MSRIFYFNQTITIITYNHLLKYYFVYCVMYSFNMILNTAIGKRYHVLLDHTAKRN